MIDLKELKNQIIDEIGHIPLTRQILELLDALKAADAVMDCAEDLDTEWADVHNLVDKYRAARGLK